MGEERKGTKYNIGNPVCDNRGSGREVSGENLTDNIDNNQISIQIPYVGA